MLELQYGDLVETFLDFFEIRFFQSDSCDLTRSIGIDIIRIGEATVRFSNRSKDPVRIILKMKNGIPESKSGMPSAGLACIGVHIYEIQKLVLRI